MSAYNALTTKIRAMQSRLLTDADFEELATCLTIGDALSCLKKHPFYKDLFADLDETLLHREQSEQRLAQAIFYDFQKIYYFADQRQRHILLLLLQKHIPRLIRGCLYQILCDETPVRPSPYVHPFFQVHTGINVPALLACDTVEGLIDVLSGTGYDLALKTAHDAPSPTLFQYELALDMHCCLTVWKNRKKYLEGTDLEVIERSLGSTLELMNLQWIFRCKKYFHIPSVNISALLIPVRYKLNKSELHALVEASSLEEFYQLIGKTYYGRLFSAYLPESFDADSFLRMEAQILDKIYLSDARRHPDSIAVINTYLHKKETEIARIVTTVEGIRYALEPNKIITYIAHT